jgi:hypothetical protein
MHDSITRAVATLREVFPRWKRKQLLRGADHYLAGAESFRPGIARYIPEFKELPETEANLMRFLYHLGWRDAWLGHESKRRVPRSVNP